MLEILGEMYELITKEEEKMNILFNDNDVEPIDIIYSILNTINKCILVRNLLKDMINSKSEVLQSEKENVEMYLDKVNIKLKETIGLFKSRVKSDKIESDDLLKLFTKKL